MPQKVLIVVPIPSGFAHHHEGERGEATQDGQDRERLHGPHSSVRTI
jgi:hypothetical protein